MSGMDQERAHARLAPSSAAQWRRCPASVKAQEAYADVSGEAAAQGTLFHEFAELAFSQGFQPHDFSGNIGRVFLVDDHEITFDKDMILNMYAGLDWLNEQQADDAIWLTEERVHIAPWTLEEGGFGTSDNIGIFKQDRRIIIQDWKYGRVPVSPDRNDQGMIYGLGAWESHARDIFDGDPSHITVDIVIDQPRAPGGGGIWQTTMKSLLKEGEDIKADAQRVIDEPDLFVPGTKQCIYCDHRKNCKAKIAFDLEVMGVTFDDLEGYDPDNPPSPPRAITPEQRTAIIAHFPVIKRWVDELSAEALGDHSAGRPIPGLKVVTGRRPRRKYRASSAKKVEQILAQRLGKDAYDVKPVSPAKAQDILGKPEYTELLEPYVEQGEGKPQLVLAEDAREALASAVEMFDEIL